MSNELTIPQGTSLALETSDQAQAVIETVVAFWPDDGTPPALRRALTGDEKQTLQKRMIELQRSTRPLAQATAEKTRAAQALAAMFLGFPSLRNTNNAAMVAAYVLAMEDLPISAVVKACEDVTKRRLKGTDPDFPPTAPRMYDAAQKHSAPMEGERIKIKKTLEGRVGDAPISEDERKRTQAKMRQFSEEMRAKLEKDTGLRGEEMERKMSELNHRQIEREWLSYGMEPMRTHGGAPVSVALARSLDPDLDIRLTNLERKRK